MNRIIEILIVSLFLFSDVIQAQNSNNHVSYLNERSAGYMMEYPVQRFWRDARLTTIGAGTSEIMKEIISKRIGL